MSTDIFKWAEDIEKIYEELIEKGKSENLSEIQKIRSEQEELLEKTVNHFRDTVNVALKSLTTNLNKEDQVILKKINNLKKKMEKKYLDNQENLINLLIKELGFDF
ncbi:MAG: hypothetical protein ACFE8N_12560 [Promethearchaeota archaeon]